MRIARPLFFLAAALSGAAAAAQDVYVDGFRGNDANPGTAARPVRSISKGVQLLKPAGTVFIQQGVYSKSGSGERFPIDVGVTKQHGDVVVRGLGTVLIDLAGSADIAFRVGSRAPGSRITNLWFVNSDSQFSTATIVSHGAAGGVEIDRCTFERVNRAIVMFDAPSPHQGDWNIHNNVFFDLHRNAIDEHEFQGGNRMFNNTIVGKPNKQSGTAIRIESGLSEVYNNVIVGMREGIWRGQNFNTKFANNCMWNNTTSWAGTLKGNAPPGNYAVDPQFVDRSRNDYRLKPTSPLIDRGRSLPQSRMDFDAAPGEIDSDQNGTTLPDVGAFELPVSRFSVSYNRTTGAGSLRITGPRNQVGFVVFARDGGVFKGPGFTLLLDPFQMIPWATPPRPLPMTLNTTIPFQPPGVRLVMQGASFDASNRRIHAAHQQWLQW